MIAKVRTLVCTEDERDQLQQLGCEEEPYITFPNELIFKATIEDEDQLANLRALPFVTSVGPMPTLRL